MRAPTEDLSILTGAEKELRQQVLVLKAAQRLARLLNKSRQVDEVVNDLIAEFMNLAQADEGSIQLLRPASETTRRTLVRRTGVERGLLDTRLDDLLTGWTATHKQVLSTDDLAATLYLGAAANDYAEICSVLAAPFLMQDQVGHWCGEFDSLAAESAFYC